MNHPEKTDESFHYMQMISGCHGKYSDEHFGQIDEPKHTVYYTGIQNKKEVGSPYFLIN